MDRRKFLKRLAIGSAAAVVAPKLLLGSSAASTHPSKGVAKSGDDLSHTKAFKFSIHNQTSEIIPSLQIFNCTFLEIDNAIKDNSMVKIFADDKEIEVEAFVNHIKNNPVKFHPIEIHCSNTKNSLLSRLYFLHTNKYYWTGYVPIGFYTYVSPYDEAINYYTLKTGHSTIIDNTMGCKLDNIQPNQKVDIIMTVDAVYIKNIISHERFLYALNK